MTPVLLALIAIVIPLVRLLKADRPDACPEHSAASGGDGVELHPVAAG